MKYILPSLLAMLLFSFTFARCDDITDTLLIKKTLNFSSTGNETRTLLVDNINGSIEVTGYDGDAVEVVVHETITAESNRKLKEAKADVTVETKEDGDRILLYVDGPWRRSDGSSDYRGYDYYGFEVNCDFEVKIPHKTDVNLKTVNGGNIKVVDVEGSFDVRNVNGGIKLRDIAGSGKAHTVNGNVEASFTKNPTEESSFQTVNGEVDVKFQKSLAADMEFKTMNGEVYSDFDMKSMPIKPASVKHRGSMKIYKSGDAFSVRVGDGGPEITFDTLNGDVYVSKYE